MGIAVDSGEIRVLDLASGEVKPVISSRHAWLVKPGFLVYQTSQGMVAQAFDVRTRTVSGPTIGLNGAGAHHDISPTGVGAPPRLKRSRNDSPSTNGIT